MNSLAQLIELGKRFQGIDLKFRRDGVNWPKPWRAECFSAKHEGVRLKAFGDTPKAAIEILEAMIEGSIK